MASPSRSRATPAEEPASERSVLVEYGHLHHDRLRLQSLQDDAARAADVWSPNAWPGVAKSRARLQDPVPAGDRFANFDLHGETAGGGTYHAYLGVTPTGVLVYVDGSKREHLLRVAGETMSMIQTTTQTARSEFAHLEAAVPRARGPHAFAELFEAYVAMNPRMPDLHIQRTLAIAHAEAGLTASAFDPSKLPTPSAAACAEHAKQAVTATRRSATKLYKPTGRAAVPESELAAALIATCAQQEEVHRLGLVFGKRYGLVLADRFLAGAP